MLKWEFVERVWGGLGGGVGGGGTKSPQTFYRVCIWALSLQHQAHIFQLGFFQTSTPLGWTLAKSKTELITE